MAIYHATDHVAWLGAYPIYTRSSSMGLEFSQAELDVTTYGDTATKRIGGLKDCSFSFEGFADMTTYDAAYSAALGTANTIVTLAPTNTENAVAYSMRGVVFQFTPFGGGPADAATFSLSGSTTQRVVRGRLLHEGSEETASASSTGYQFGTQNGNTMYAALHVTEIDAVGTLDVIIERDDNAGFTSPTTVASFTQATSSITSEWVTSSIASADDYYRATWTIGGSGDYDFSTVVGFL